MRAIAVPIAVALWLAHLATPASAQPPDTTRAAPGEAERSRRRENGV